MPLSAPCSANAACVEGSRNSAQIGDAGCADDIYDGQCVRGEQCGVLSLSLAALYEADLLATGLRGHSIIGRSSGNLDLPFSKPTAVQPWHCCSTGNTRRR